jgi:hypothetical protein
VTAVTPIRFSEIDPPGPRKYVVESIAPKDHATTLFGDGGSAKSILALSIGTAVASDAERWLNREVRNCPVLYIDFELDADEQQSAGSPKVKVALATMHPSPKGAALDSRGSLVGAGVKDST